MVINKKTTLCKTNLSNFDFKINDIFNKVEKRHKKIKRAKLLMPMHINSALHYCKAKLAQNEMTPEIARIERLLNCGSNFVDTFYNDNSYKSNIISCKIRFCPICEMKKSLLRQAQIINILPLIEKKFPDHSWVNLNLTIRNHSLKNIGFWFDKMSQAFRDMRFDRISGFIGFVKNFEITQDENGKAHPHFHIMILTNSNYSNNPLCQNKMLWVEKWQKAMKSNYGPNLWIKRIGISKKDFENKKIAKKYLGLTFAEAQKQSQKDSINDILKYSLKPADTISPFGIIARNQLTGKRLYSTSKSITKLIKETETTSEDIKAILQNFYFWNSETKFYELTKSLFADEIEDEQKQKDFVKEQRKLNKNKYIKKHTQSTKYSSLESQKNKLDEYLTNPI